MTTPLSDERINKFSLLIEEASRSTQEGVRYFIEPAAGVLDRAKSRRHHFIFGRRGSGKSSLIAKTEQDLTLDRSPVARVDLEPFKGHSYPDLLISVLIATFGSFEKWLATFATASAAKTSIWSRFFDRKPTNKPFDKKSVQKLLDRLKKELIDLDAQLYLVDDAEVQIDVEKGEIQSQSTSIDLKLTRSGVAPGIGQSEK